MPKPKKPEYQPEKEEVKVEKSRRDPFYLLLYLSKNWITQKISQNIIFTKVL